MGTVHQVPKPIPRSVSCQAPWEDGSVTVRAVLGTAGTGWISLLKCVILTLIQEHNVLSAHSVCSISHTRAAVDATGALSKASPQPQPGSWRGQVLQLNC